jgi:hypothetical protein
MINKAIKITTLSFIIVVMIGCAGSSTQNKDVLTNTTAVGNSAETVSKAGQMSLTEALVRQLGVTDTQAQGGAGAIMQYTKDSLSPSDFSEVANVIPDIDNLLSAAPSTSGITGQAMSAVSGATGDLGGAAELTSAFQQLNLSPDMVSQFVPVIANYVKTFGSDQTASILKSALGGLI